MRVHIEHDLVNWNKKWEALLRKHPDDFSEFLSKQALASRIGRGRGRPQTIPRAAPTYDVREDPMVGLFDEVLKKVGDSDVTVVCPDREDICVFEGTPDVVRRIIFG